MAESDRLATRGNGGNGDTLGSVPAVKIKAEPCTGRDLKPGDLFSTSGPEYWDKFSTRDSLGERVYIRTEQELHSGNSHDADAPVFRITILDGERPDRAPLPEADVSPTKKEE